MTARKRGRKPPLPKMPNNWSELLDRCPFRSFIGIGSSADEMLKRLSYTFTALGGEPCAIEPDLLANMAASVQAGYVVLVLADRRDLRDRAKREIMAAVHGAAGSA